LFVYVNHSEWKWKTSQSLQRNQSIPYKEEYISSEMTATLEWEEGRAWAK